MSQTTPNIGLPTDFEGWVRLKANLKAAMLLIDSQIAAFSPEGGMTAVAAEAGTSEDAVLISPKVLADEIDRRIAAAAV